MLTQLYIRTRVLLVFALLAVMGATALWGQAANGTITGTATDPSGTATVKVESTVSQVACTVATNTQGRYTVVDKDHVRVTRTGVQVDTSLSAVSTLVDHLPLSGRNYTQLITLVPDVPAMKPSAPSVYGTGEDHSAGGTLLQPQEEQSTLENLMPGAVVIAGRRIQLCLDMSVDAHAGFCWIPQLPSVHVGSNLASGRDVFPVA